MDLKLVTLYTNLEGIELWHERKSFIAYKENCGQGWKIQVDEKFVTYSEDYVGVDGESFLFTINKC
jgi:hypothetical protein